MTKAPIPYQKARRAASRKFAEGGSVLGSGTGTSDDVPDEVRNGTYIMPADSTAAIGEQQLSTMGARGFSPGRDKVPVQLSNGEYKLPPEQVHAIGAQALDEMKAATHTPAAARGFAPGAGRGAPQVPEPPMFFADGGLVDDEQRRPNSFGDAAAAARDSSVTAVSPVPAAAPAPAPVMPSPSSPSNTFPGNRLQGNSGFSGAPSGQAARVGATAAPAPAPAAPVQAQARGFSPEQRSTAISQIPTDGQRSAPLPDGSQRDPMNTDVGRNLSNLANALPGSLGNSLSTVARTGGAISGVLNSGSTVARGFAAGAGLGSNAARASTPSPALPDTTTPVSATPAAGATPAGGQPGSHEFGPPNLSALRPPETSEVMPGIFRSGNSYGDSAQAAEAGAVPRGLPSPRNMAAADALADRSQAESLARVTAARGFTPGFTGVIGQTTGNGNMWSRTPEQQQRDAEVSASSIMSPPQARGLAAMRRVSDMDRARIAQAGNDTALQQTAMQTGAQLGAVGLREQGDTSRAIMREQGETTRAAARNAIDQGRLNLEQQVRGFDIRRGQRQERAVDRYLQAATPQEQQSALQRMRAMNGEPDPTPWALQVTPATKNADGSTTEGSVMRYNRSTGQVERVDAGGSRGQPPAKESLVAGQVYTTPSGQLRWNGQAFERVG